MIDIAKPDNTQHISEVKYIMRVIRIASGEEKKKKEKKVITTYFEFYETDGDSETCSR